MAIRREATTNIRLARQHEQRQRQQRARDQLRQARAELTPEQLEIRQQQDRDRRADMTPERLVFRQQQDRQQHRNSRAALTPEQLEVQQQQDRDRTQQQRAIEDVNHTQVLEQLRDVTRQYPITDDIIAHFSRMVLTAQDVLDEPEWRHAPVAVTSNIERAELNQDRR
jgi:hypothetical protein